MVDRSYAPGSDMECLLREYRIPLWALESRQPLNQFELIGFSLQYELTYTNILNMLDLSSVPLLSKERSDLFPLIFAGGPAAINPEPMVDFMDFFIIGDGEKCLPEIMELLRNFKKETNNSKRTDQKALKKRLLWQLATSLSGVYVPGFYQVEKNSPVPTPLSVKEIFSSDDLEVLTYSEKKASLAERVLRQVVPLNDENQPTSSIVPYLACVHDREILEVRRGCDRGCRFCQPGYTFLPVRERSKDELTELSKKALAQSGHQEYSMLSLCVSDYTALHESVRALNKEHAKRHSSLSFPSQRADRMNLDLAEELSIVRKSGITLAPEAGKITQSSN